MKIISIALAAFICLPIFALAVPDSVVTGPYNVTFNLSIPKEAYGINISDPKTKEDLSGHTRTEYEMELVNRTGDQPVVTITIALHDDPLIVPTQDDLVQRLDQAIEEKTYTHNVKAAGRTIDGHSGAVSSWERLSIDNEREYYHAIYYLSSYETVTIFSSYPWEEGTLSLLKTIHVEKTNSTS